MQPGAYNTTTPQGSRFERVLTWKNASDEIIPLINYTARMHVRATKESSDTKLSLASSSGITIDGEAGQVTIVATASQMAAVPAGNLAYDIELIPPGGEEYAFRWIEGVLTVTREVTRT